MAHTIMGNSNARPKYRSEGEQPNIGPFFVGRGEEFALHTVDNTQGNRKLFAAAIREHDMPP